VTVNIQSIKGWSRREPQGECVAKRQRLGLGFRVYSDRRNLVENIRKREEETRNGREAGKLVLRRSEALSMMRGINTLRRAGLRVDVQMIR
jgi:hypothetical protein